MTRGVAARPAIVVGAGNAEFEIPKTGTMARPELTKHGPGATRERRLAGVDTSRWWSGTKDAIGAVGVY